MYYDLDFIRTEYDKQRLELQIEKQTYIKQYNLRSQDHLNLNWIYK